jgi:hypothetical protein
MADVHTGALRDTDELLAGRLDEIARYVRPLGGEQALADARRLIQHGGADRQRALAAELGLRGLVEQLAEEFVR